MSLTPIDEKLFTIFHFKTFINILLSIDPRIIKRPLLDTPGYGESNEPYFAFLWSLGGEIMWFKGFKKNLSEH